MRRELSGDDHLLQLVDIFLDFDARIAKLMGYQKIITYTLATENGASLRASGWQCAPELRGGGNWNVPGRPRADSRNTGPKRLYYKELR